MRSLFDDFVFASPEFEWLIDSLLGGSHPVMVVKRPMDVGHGSEDMPTRTEPRKSVTTTIGSQNGNSVTLGSDVDECCPIKVVPGQTVKVRENDLPEYARKSVYRQPKSIMDSIDKLFPQKTNEDVHPFVFISNRMTFLVKTRYPVIFDTSAIKAKGEDKVFVAFDKSKNPKLDIREATRIANEVNFDKEIQDEVRQFLSRCKWNDIVCSPTVTWVNKEPRMGFMFTLVGKND